MCILQSKGQGGNTVYRCSRVGADGVQGKPSYGKLVKGLPLKLNQCIEGIPLFYLCRDVDSWNSVGLSVGKLRSVLSAVAIYMVRELVERGSIFKIFKLKRLWSIVV